VLQTIIQNAVDAISLGSLFALTALGIGLIFGVMRLINFAHGDFIMVGAYALIVPSAADAAMMFIGAWPAPILVISIISVLIVVALASERVAFRPLRTADPSILLITSFALSFFLQNLVLMVYSGRPKGIPLWPNLIKPVLVGEIRIPQLHIITISVTLGLLILLVLFLKRTAIGIQMRAASEDFRMAQLLGVRGNRVIAVAFAISGLLAAVVALLFVAQTGTLSYKMGVPLVLFAFVATVVGGMGSLSGAVLGGFVVGIASVLFQAILPADMRLNDDAWVFGLILLILLVRPTGLVAVKALQERV
jgi:branched-chain amino acid transport system permease protein